MPLLSLWSNNCKSINLYIIHFKALPIICYISSSLEISDFHSFISPGAPSVSPGRNGPDADRQTAARVGNGAHSGASCDSSCCDDSACSSGSRQLLLRSPSSCCLPRLCLGSRSCLQELGSFAAEANCWSILSVNTHTQKHTHLHTHTRVFENISPKYCSTLTQYRIHAWSFRAG